MSESQLDEMFLSLPAEELKQIIAQVRARRGRTCELGLNGVAMVITKARLLRYLHHLLAMRAEVLRIVAGNLYAALERGPAAPAAGQFLNLASWVGYPSTEFNTVMQYSHPPAGGVSTWFLELPVEDQASVLQLVALQLESLAEEQNVR